MKAKLLKPPRAPNIVKILNIHQKNPLCLERKVFTNEKARIDFINAMRVKQYRINDSVTLTDKEFKCAIGMIKGQTAEEIATVYNKSRRTIETHILSIKHKLDCRTKSQLISALIENGLGVYINNKA